MAHPYLDGKMLIAMPGIGDERFDRAVIYVCAILPTAPWG